MTPETQFKIQALLDGELPEGEAREVSALLARDPAAAALHAELAQLRRAMTGLEEPRSLPESREFYWSKIRRDIERTERAPAPAAAEPWWTAWRMWFRPAGVLAGVTLVALLFLVPAGRGGGATAMVAAFADGGAITFRDESTGTTFVWFTYPAENGVAEAGNVTTLTTP